MNGWLDGGMTNISLKKKNVRQNEQKIPFNSVANMQE